MHSDETFKLAYDSCNGNRTEMAHRLKVSRGTTFNWCKKYETGNPNASAKAKLSTPDEVRELRKNEQRAEKLERELAQERERRRIAEADLETAVETSELLNSVMCRTPEAVALPLDQKPTVGGCSAIVCCTDWHLEKRIVKSTVSGLNEFNLDIAAGRINRLWTKAVYLIDFFRHIGLVDEIILWLGGDLINNHLHDEDVESNMLGPAEAVALLQDHIATGISTLDSVPGANLRVIANYGNHARTTRFQRQGTGWKHSWEWLTYHSLSKMFKDVPFQIAQGYFNYSNVQGYNVRFHHGEAVKYNGGVGGLQIPMNKALAQWDKAVHADYSINGHYHTYKDEWTWTSCGSLCGYDSFAQSIKADYQEPTQTIVFIDKARGKVASLPIFVEKPKK